MIDETSHGPGPDQGSATVLVVGVCAVVILLAAAAVMVTSAAHASVRAQTAADLGALAGAAARLHLLVGTSQVDPCSVAAEVARGNGADVDSCALDDAVNVTVRVSVRGPGPLSRVVGASSATASARAGPAAPPP